MPPKTRSCKRSKEEAEDGVGKGDEPATKIARTEEPVAAPAEISVPPVETVVAATSAEEKKEDASVAEHAEIPKEPTSAEPTSAEPTSAEPTAATTTEPTAAATSTGEGSSAITLAPIVPEFPKIDLVFSFDTTGSMSQCIREVRRNVKETIERLLQQIPNIRIGLIAHGDYCDSTSAYVLRKLDLTRDLPELIDFVNNKATDTFGGDWPECYELALNEARENMSWDPAAIKRFILIGDAIPHEPNSNPRKLDWRVEARSCGEKGISIYAVQCMHESSAKKFFSEVADLSKGQYLQLHNFSSIPLMVNAVAFREAGQDQLQLFEQETRTNGQMSRDVVRMFDSLAGRTASVDAVPPSELKASAPGRFQVLKVTEKTSIKDFVEENGLKFKPGRGFYQFTKPEVISEKKEIVLRSKTLGDCFEGERAQEIIGSRSKDRKKKISPGDIKDYDIFVQSTSYNRVLMPNTSFLYEMDPV